MINSKMIQFTDERKLVVPELYPKSRHDEVNWMISFAFSKETQLMWVGCDGKKESDTFRKTQKTFYLPQMNQVLTSTSIFAETLKRILKFADHFKKESVAVTYDFDIAKIAM